MKSKASVKSDEQQIEIPRWPLKEEHAMEIARWPYEPTEERNGGEWVYALTVRPLDRYWGKLLEFRVQVTRRRFDFVTKREGFAERVQGGYFSLRRGDVSGFEHVYRQWHGLALELARRAEEQYRKRREAMDW